MVDRNSSSNNEDEIKTQAKQEIFNLEQLQLQLKQEQVKNQQLTSSLLATQQKVAELETQLNQRIFELKLYCDLSQQINSNLSYEDFFSVNVKTFTHCSSL